MPILTVNRLNFWSILLNPLENPLFSIKKGLTENRKSLPDGRQVWCCFRIFDVIPLEIG